MATSYATRLMGSAPAPFSFRYALVCSIKGRKLLIEHSGTSSAIPRDEDYAFDMQIEEVDRALDNLNKSSGMSQHRHSIGDYDQMRSQHSGSNLQNFYANQRHQSRPNEAEQMMQVKRRMAAQRERELRNYHQEQQYNRST
ncbi:MAG: hypothetical protein Q9215_003862 [Flavoplaca cf. flavocitrina]